MACSLRCDNKAWCYPPGLPASINDVPIQFSTSRGTITPQSTTVSGAATATLTVSQPGAVTVTATLDGQVVNTVLDAPLSASGLAGSSSGSSISLTWNAPTSGTPLATYIIEAGTAPGLANLAKFATGSTQTSFAASGVSNGLYYLRVRASNVLGEGGPSNEIALRVGPVPPGAPTGLSANAAGSTLTLSWTAPVAGGAPTSYTIEAGSSSGLSNLADFSTGNASTSFVATGVANGTYFLRVRASNLGGTSPASNEVAAVVGPAAPGVPTGLQWSSAGSTIVLTWNAPSSGGAPSSYTIEAGSAPGLANLANLATGNSATSFTSGGVGNGTYYVRVKAGNTGGTSGASNEVALVVGCTAAPGAPSGVHTDLNSGGTVQFGWTAPTFVGTSNGPTTYVLEAGSAAGQANLAVLDLGGSATTATFGGIGSGTYYVRIKSKNSCGTGAASNDFMLIVQ